MFMKFKKSWMILAITFVAGCNSGGDKEHDYSLYERYGEPTYRLKSAYTIDLLNHKIGTHEYPIYVHTPADYDADGYPYPVIYATDGQWTSSEYDAILDELGTQVILVSIGEGPRNQRQRDYIQPGLDNYFKFLSKELIPQIENDYNIDPKQRLLVGYSFGGNMAGTIMMLDDPFDPVFNAYAAYDPAFRHTFNHQIHEFNDYFDQLVDDRYAASEVWDTEFLMTGALQSTLAENVKTHSERLNKRGFQDLKIETAYFDVDHDNIALPSFRYTVEYFYPTNPIPNPTDK
ncbi:hypothetical protein JCM19237_6345 [Photobacterium aphoticum]|uniref:Esterase n=1 Tax=Photobacterium aphoticum TaxID=754436 RepID=A0A090QKM1_9GAMM|nr:hypothetical protein JCM19237_6345 [Photobacterium aphoticum]